MKFDHVVKFGGEYYEAGQEVPIENPPVFPDEGQIPFSDPEEDSFSDRDIELEEKPNRYTYDELDNMTVKRIRQLALDMGFEITKSSKDDVINEFLSKQ